MKIAIDGLSGSGKSTAAKELSKRLGIIYIDTGAMYRTLALCCLREGIDLSDEKAVTEALNRNKIELVFCDGQQRVLLNSEDVTDIIRLQLYGNGASAVAVHKQVRQGLVKLQQAFAKGGQCIMDGRDIGTVVMPDADLKIYLKAGEDARAKRRCAELAAKNEDYDFEAIRREIIERDYQDMNREHSPALAAADAIELDSTQMTTHEVVEHIIKLYMEKGGA